MIIYGALLIPVLVAFILFKYFSHKTVWWEFFIPLIASLIFITTSKMIIESAQVSCKEYWGSFIKKVEYYEDWNEYIQQTCECCCDEDGNNCDTYDCSYVDYHPAYYQIITTTNETISISEGEYLKLKRHFGNDFFTDMHRDYHTNDGDLLYSMWEGDSVKAIPVTTIHTYENRVKAADQSVFHFEPVNDSDKTKYDLKDYPKIYSYYKMNTVLGDDSPDARLANKKFQYINGLLGSKKEVHIFVLVFKDQPVNAAIKQKWYWSGANMNEFVICIGTDSKRNVTWCQPISWTKNETLKAEIQRYVQQQKQLNLCKLADYTQIKIDEGFKRLDFKQFNYLTVDPPLWAVILTYFLTLLLNFGLSKWIIDNEHEEYRNRRRW